MAWIFLKHKIFMKKGFWRLQQYFPYKSSKFSENSNCCLNLLFNPKDGIPILVLFDLLFSFLAFFKL